MSTQTVTAFIYQMDDTIQGQLKQFAKLQIPAGEANPELTAWSTYIRQHGTPPIADYVVFVGGHHKQVKATQTLIVADLGAAS